MPSRWLVTSTDTDNQPMIIFPAITAGLLPPVEASSRPRVNVTVEHGVVQGQTDGPYVNRVFEATGGALRDDSESAWPPEGSCSRTGDLQKVCHFAVLCVLSGRDFLPAIKGMGCFKLWNHSPKLLQMKGCYQHLSSSRGKENGSGHQFTNAGMKLWRFSDPGISSTARRYSTNWRSTPSGLVSEKEENMWGTQSCTYRSVFCLKWVKDSELRLPECSTWRYNFFAEIQPGNTVTLSLPQGYYRSAPRGFGEARFQATVGRSPRGSWQRAVSSSVYATTHASTRPGRRRLQHAAAVPRSRALIEARAAGMAGHAGSAHFPHPGAGAIAFLLLFGSAYLS